MSKTSENTLEQTALNWFESLGWQTAFGPDISPDGPACEREDYDHVVLLGRLQTALKNINHDPRGVRFCQQVTRVIIVISNRLLSIIINHLI